MNAITQTEARHCPFCGSAGVIEITELNGEAYYTIGCATRDCYAYVGLQTVALPHNEAVKHLSAWNTVASPRESPNLATLSCHLDEYRVAADVLDDNGFATQASVFREMHDRVIGLFLADWKVGKHDFSKPYVINGRIVATDGRILVRISSSSPDTTYIASDKQHNAALRVLSDYVENWDDSGEGAWVSFQHLQPITDDEQRWQACPDRFAERLIARHLYDRIMRLPDPEYLHDVDNYIGDHAKQPLRFRFRCGDGVVMPMEGQDDD